MSRVRTRFTFFTLRRTRSTIAQTNPAPDQQRARRRQRAAPRPGNASRIPRHQAAVHRDDRAGQERRGRQAQAECHVRDLLRVAVAAERGAAFGVDGLVLVAGYGVVSRCVIGPGQMQFTVMPSRPSSTASERVDPDDAGLRHRIGLAAQLRRAPRSRRY